MHAPIPAVEIAHHANAQRVRRPNRKMHPAQPGDLPNMRAHLFVEHLVRAFAEQVQVEIGKQRRKSVRVGNFAAVAVVPADAQAIAFRAQRTRDARRQKRLENSLGLHARSRNRLAIDQHRDLGSERLNRPNHQPRRAIAFHHMRPQNAQGVRMLSPQKPRIFAQRLRRVCRVLPRDFWPLRQVSASQKLVNRHHHSIELALRRAIFLTAGPLLTLQRRPHTTTSGIPLRTRVYRLAGNCQASGRTYHAPRSKPHRIDDLSSPALDHTETTAFSVIGQNLLKDQRIEYLNEPDVVQSGMVKRSVDGKFSWLRGSENWCI